MSSSQRGIYAILDTTFAGQAIVETRLFLSNTMDTLFRLLIEFRGQWRREIYNLISFLEIETHCPGLILDQGHAVGIVFISIHSLRMEGDSKTAQESVFHFAYPCTILQKRMQKTTFCTRKNGFFRKKGEKFGAKPSASFCAPMIRTDTFPLNFSHRISGSSMSMVSFAPICSTFD